MSYIITSTTGATIATIAEGTINTSVTSLTLVGKNYTGYGALINENFVKLLENFSHVVSPPAPVTGQLWYDSNEHVLKVYTTNYGGVWKPISSSATGAVAPIGPVTGDLWWDTANTQLKVYSGSTWVTIGPTYTATSGTSGAIVETIIDSTTASHVVVKTYISNAAISILSKDPEFTPQTSIPGFTTIKPGLNLISSGTVAGIQFTGNVSNSLLLNGIADTQFLRSDAPITTSAMLTAGGGVTVGANLVIADTAGTISLTNSALNKDLNVYVNKAGVTTQAINVNGTTGAITFGGAVVMSTASATTLTGTTINNTTFNGVTVGATTVNATTVNATNAVATNITGTLQTAAQPNVTSLGTLTGITVNGSSRDNSLGVGTAASGVAGEIRATNNITAYYSDDRLKTRLGKIENALDKVDQLNGFYHEANETAQQLGYDKIREVGVSAQEVFAVLPEITAPAPIDPQYMTVRYERLTPLLIEAIKELRAEVNAIKQQISNV